MSASPGCVDWIVERVVLGPPWVDPELIVKEGEEKNLFSPESFGESQLATVKEFVDDPSKPVLFLWWDPSDTANDGEWAHSTVPPAGPGSVLSSPAGAHRALCLFRLASPHQAPCTSP